MNVDAASELCTAAAAMRGVLRPDHINVVMSFQRAGGAGRCRAGRIAAAMRGATMLRYLTAASIFAVALPLAGSPAIAQERFGDAALGALSGAVVLGPVGAVAGALVGYTAGPNIAHSWGFHSSEHRSPHTATTGRPAKRTVAGTAPAAAPAPAASMPAPAAAPAGNPAPSATMSPAATTTPAVKSAGNAVDAPPVQGFE